MPSEAKLAHGAYAREHDPQHLRLRRRRREPPKPGPESGLDATLPMSAMQHPLHATFVAVYLLVLIGVGAIKARKITTQADFSLAGRGLPSFVLVGTLLATWIGTGSIFGNAEKTLQIGVPALLIPIAGGLGILALWALASRIRSFGQFTIQDILEARFGVWARVLATMALISAYVIIVSYQYRAGAVALKYVFPDLDHATTVYCVAGFVILYTALAGMFSVAYTDVANGVMMVIGIAAAIPILLEHAGGWQAAIDSLPAGQQLISDHWTPLKLLAVLLPSFLLIVGDANMYQRFFSAKNPRDARRSALGMLIGVVVLELAIIVVALLASALVSQGQLEAPQRPGHIIVLAAFEVLPDFLGAMLVATTVAVVVSTADSYLLSPSTSVVRDIYQRFIRPDASDAQTVLAGRVCVIVLGLIALGLAFSSDEFFAVALFAYTIYGSAITPALLAAFFWKRANQAGAVASIIVGGGTALIWESLGFLRSTPERAGQAWADQVSGWLNLGTFDPIADVGAVLVSFPLSVLALVIFSLCYPAPHKDRANAL